MISSRTLVTASVVTLLGSVLANLVAMSPGAVAWFPLLFWIHIAIIVLGVWGGVRSRRLKSTLPEFLASFVPGSRAVIALGAIVLAIASLTFQYLNFDFGTLPDGTAVHSMNWSENDGKYWLSLNGQAAVEIARNQYEELQQESYAFFAFFWVIFSYVILLQWHGIARREATCTQ